MPRFYVVLTLIFSFFVLSDDAYGERMFTYDHESWVISEYNTLNFNVIKTINVKHVNYGPESKEEPGESKVRLSNQCGITHYDKNRGIVRQFDGNTLNLLRTITIPKKLAGKRTEDDTIEEFIFSDSTCGYIYYVDAPLRHSTTYPKRRKLSLWFYDGLKSVEHSIKYDVNCYGQDGDDAGDGQGGECVKKDRHFGPYFTSQGNGFYMVNESREFGYDNDGKAQYEDKTFTVSEYVMKTSQTMERKTLYKWKAETCVCEDAGSCGNCRAGVVEFRNIVGGYKNETVYDYFTLNGDMKSGGNVVNIFRIGNGRFKKEPIRTTDKTIEPYYSKYPKPYLRLSGVENTGDEPNAFSINLEYVGAKKRSLFKEWQYMGNFEYGFDVTPANYAMSKDKRYVATTIEFGTNFEDDNKSYIKNTVTAKAISAVKNYRVTSRKFPAVFIYDTRLRSPLKHKLHNNIFILWLSSKRLLMERVNDGIVVFDIVTGKFSETGILSFEGKELFLF